MFNQLTQKLSGLVHSFRGKTQLTEENIQESLQEVRNALIEADVALSVIDSFLQQVQSKALGQEIITKINPAQAFIKLVYDELTILMGEKNSELNLRTEPPAIILMAGLQGSGKTTTVAKLARYLKENLKKTVLVASADIYRPAAIQQLETLAGQVNVHFHPSHSEQSPITIAKDAIASAKRQLIDVVIIDTAGRLHIDEQMMQEIKALHQAINPIETLFVVDSMTGQDAANTAKAFNDALPLTGVILTKTDGDARGGAALSVRAITGKPIKFLGIGEKIDAIEPFYPDRIASRILDMGDILTLVEEAQRHFDQKESEKLTKKILKGVGFDFDDFLAQIEQMQKMGGINSLVSKLPGMNALPQAAKDKINDKSFIQIKALIQSMTLKERRFPKLIINSGSRKRRITKGSGTNLQDLNKLLRQFDQMQKMMKKFSKPGAMKKMMSQLPKGFSPEDLM